MSFLVFKSTTEVFSPVTPFPLMTCYSKMLLLSCFSTVCQILQSFSFKLCEQLDITECVLVLLAIH